MRPRPDQTTSAFLGLRYLAATLRALPRPRLPPFQLPFISKKSFESCGCSSSRRSPTLVAIMASTSERRLSNYPSASFPGSFAISHRSYEGAQGLADSMPHTKRTCDLGLRTND
jgi:hypothetical protein